MFIKDKVYSDFEVTDLLALDLINTEAFQRLKYISQSGIPNKYYYYQGCSRYEHSLGVYILLNRLGASREEQICGLLHDISHTAFSHLVDWVVGDKLQEDYQDKRHLSILQQPEIANVLAKYKYAPQQFADYTNYTLLEANMPDLCADRVDYAFREFDPKVTRDSLPGLIVSNGQIVFNSPTLALLFAQNFLKMQAKIFAGYEGVTRYSLFSDLLKQAIAAKDISLEDFSRTDDFVVDKIIKTNNQGYLKILNILENRDLSFLTKSTNKIIKKFRYVDPMILLDGQPKRLSAINPEFKQELEEARQQNLQGISPGIIK